MHVRLLVEAYEDCFRFYRDVLGFDPVFGDADSGYADFDTGDVTLALFAADEMAGPTDDPEWGIRTVHARDPDGTLIEWNEPLE